MYKRFGAMALLALLLVGCQHYELTDTSYIPPFTSEEHSDFSELAWPVREQRFQRADGTEVFGVSVMVDEQAPHLLVFPGNGQSVDRSLIAIAQRLAPLGMNLHLFDRRGQGRDESTVSGEKLTDDALAVFDFLQARLGEQPYVLGYSLGGFEAVAVARQRPLDALVLVATSTNVDEHLAHAVPWYYKPFVSFEVDPILRTIDNRRDIAQVSVPTLFIAGEDDRQTPAALTEALFNASPAERRQLAIIEDAHHNNLMAKEQTLAAICQFLDGPGCKAG